MRKSVLALSFMFFAVVCGFAQDSDEWYIGKTIKNITFKGFVTVSSNEVNGVVEPYRGKSFSQELLDEMVSTLYALDYFERVTPASLPSEGSYEAVTIEFTVVERPIIGEIRFTGNKKISAGTLREEILIKTGDMLNKTRVLMDEETVRKHYLEKGFPGVKVTSSIEDNERNQRKIVIFQITEGNQTTIRSLQFVGNNVFSSRTLKGQMESGEQWFFNSGVFNEQTFEEDKRKIESFYKERGYIDAKVDNVLKEEEVSEEDGRTYLALTIYLSEGNQFQYGGMTFEGNQLFSTETLSDSLRVKPEGPINLPRVDADYQRIIDLYSENGYIFNDIRRQEVRDELRRTVSYIVEITERNRAHIENIIIRGNKKTKSYVLERELLMESGDIFSKSKIMESLNNLYNLQYFSNINVETPEGSAYGLMDLIFNVEESSMSEIMFGLAFGGSADFPVSANVRWTDRNFFGRGQVFSIDVTASPVMQSLTFNFLEKWLLGKRWSGNFDFTIRHTQYSGIPQDILAPLYTGSKPGIDAFPDPFTGEYVYASNGQPWRGGVGADGKPSAADIDRFNLVTDYEYAGGNTAIVPNQYKMSYEAVDFSLGFGTGYRFRTPLGILGPGIGARTTLTYLQYDDALYRPYLAADRANHGTWMFANQLSLGLSLDSRDNSFNPTTGYLVSQGVRFVGGPLRGEKHYVKTDSKIENFNTLIDWQVTDTWSYRLVLGLHSVISFIVPTFWAPAGYDRLTAGTSDLLWIDGMYIARGWGRELDKRVIWDNWAELRMPISERIVWFDIFFDMVGRWNNPDDFKKDFKIQDFLFGYGAGLRFSIPQFPIRFYLAKRFTVTESGKAEFRRGSLGRGVMDLDFVFSIGYEIYNQ